MTRTILLVEDNWHILKINRDALTEAGYKVLQAETITQACGLLEGEAPDLIVLDIMLPDGDGLELCRRIRGGNNTPILFLSAKKNNDEIVAGLKAGGDDYLPKPYDLNVLLARIEALLRRTDRKPETEIVKGELLLDTINLRAYVGEKDLALTPKEFALLLHLVRNEGMTIQTRRLYEAVWGQPMGKDANAIRVAMSRLRGKIEVAGFQIVFERGGGYCFEKI